MGIALLILLVIAVLTYVIFEKSGLWLVEDDDFEHVKWVAVLDGQTSDLERSDFAANLLKEGKADSVLLLGRRVFRDRSNSEFYADDFMKLGSFDSNAVFLVPHNDPSTISEAYTLIPWLKARNIDMQEKRTAQRRSAVHRISFSVLLQHASRTAGKTEPSELLRTC